MSAHDPAVALAAFEDFARKVAHELGAGWWLAGRATSGPLHTSVRLVDSTAGEGLVLIDGDTTEKKSDTDRLIIKPDYEPTGLHPHVLNVIPASITVARTRTPHEVARAITVRLLPTYRDAVAKALAGIEAAAAREAAQRADLAERLGGQVREPGAGSPVVVAGEVIAITSADRVDFLINVDPDRARELADHLARFFDPGAAARAAAGIPAVLAATAQPGMHAEAPTVPGAAADTTAPPPVAAEAGHQGAGL
ncbi:hypothetical protein ACIGO9_29660 [Nocardia asteroides]|uniref:hypothetical protein n=1 Tax=Nocardia asteroides TaxID=1824 RepID=UPI0037C68FBC